MEILPEFELVVATSVADVTACLANNPDARLLGGGTDLLPNMRRGLVETETVVDISDVEELKGVTLHDDGGLTIGASVTLATLSQDAGVLEKFTAIAEAARGDLFVSLHANASRRRATAGVETYYLDENYERHALNLAARENGIPRGQVNVLQETLAKLHMQEVSPFSRRLAETVQDRLVSGMSKRWRP